MHARHYEVLRELGDCYTSLGKYGQAQQCYDKAATLGPDEPGPYIGLGVAALQTDKLDDAEIAFRVAYRLDPQCAKACAGLALVARRRTSQAFDYYVAQLDADNIMAFHLLSGSPADGLFPGDRLSGRTQMH
jgi:cytochrome c-type biogenesis protein CcmH/NrfG